MKKGFMTKSLYNRLLKGYNNLMVKYSRINPAFNCRYIMYKYCLYSFFFLLRFEFDVNSEVFHGFFSVYGDNIFIITFIKLLVFWLFSLYKSLWQICGNRRTCKNCGCFICCYCCNHSLSGIFTAIFP